MPDLILTGASRGIGRALALALATLGDDRLLLVARDGQRLNDVAAAVEAAGGHALAVPGDLGSLTAARDLGDRLAALATPGATLIHNAGVWPTRRTLTPDGLETSFVVNHLGPLAMQQPLLDGDRLARVLAVSAGLIARGKFDSQRTPTGDDFSGLRTYATTKLCFALAMRDLATAQPGLDVLVLHPGVVRTDLGARPGPLGWLLSLVKRRWEAPETCAARLATLLAQPRWSPSGAAHWYVEDHEEAWPAVADDEATRRAVRDTTARLLGERLPTA